MPMPLLVRALPFVFLPLVIVGLRPAEESSAARERSAGPRQVALLVYEGVELLDFAGPGEVLSAAHGPTGHAFHVFTVAATAAPVKSQGFVTITPQYTFENCPPADVVIVPGGDVPDDRAHVDWIHARAAKAELMMSVCNGALLLAEAGLLEGLEVTTHHGSLERLAARSKARVLSNRRFVDSDTVLTCAGVSAGIDGALHLVERWLGPESARATARYMEYDWRPEEIARQHATPGVVVGG